MKVALACDHGGYALKQPIFELLEGELGCQVLDLGAHRYQADDDYPDYARYVGQAVQHEQAARGVLLCGSGVGAAVAANKLLGVRAAVCHDCYSARQGVEHDDLNVLCLGARIVGVELAYDVVRRFIQARFDPSERYQRRLEQIKALEAGR